MCRNSLPELDFGRELVYALQALSNTRTAADSISDCAEFDLAPYPPKNVYPRQRAYPAVLTPHPADMISNPYLKYRERPWIFNEQSAAELEQLTEGVIVVNESGSIVFANAVAIAMHGRLIMGVLPDDYSPVHGLFTEDGRPYPSTDLPLARAAMLGETVLGARWRVRRPDGSSVTAMGDAMPLSDAQGKQTGAILIFHQTSS